MTWSYRLVAGAVLAVCLGSMATWAARNPYPIHWDNAEYLNNCRSDLNALRAEGWPGLSRSLFRTGVYRPPAHRLLAAVASPWFGAELGTLRLVSLVSWILAVGAIFLGVRSVAGERAGWLATAVMASSLALQRSIRCFGSETALYLAVAATFGFLLKGLAARSRSWWLAVGLGLALGLGSLAKLTFPSVVGLPLVLAVVLAWRGAMPGLGIGGLALAAAVAAVLALPWYAVNYPYVWMMARIAQSSERYALDASSWRLGALWASQAWAETGVALSVLMLGLLVAIAVSRALRPFLPWSRHARYGIWVCVLGVLPLPLVQVLTSSNHVFRIVSPVFIPLAAALAIAAQAAGLLRRVSIGAIAFGLFSWHTYAFVLPEAVGRTEAWDWEAVYTLVRRSTPGTPRIAYLGQASQYNRETIAGPFVRRNQSLEIRWLWNGDQGPIRWPRALRPLDQTDAVLVLPKHVEPAGYYGWQVDNAHNAELDRRLRADGRFVGPIQLLLRGQPPLVLHVYLRRQHASAPTPDAAGRRE